MTKKEQVRSVITYEARDASGKLIDHWAFELDPKDPRDRFVLEVTNRYEPGSDEQQQFIKAVFSAGIFQLAKEAGHPEPSDADSARYRGARITMKCIPLEPNE